MGRRTIKLTALLLPLGLALGIAVTTALSYGNALAKADEERNEAMEKIVAYLKDQKADMQPEKLKSVVHKVYNESQQCDIDYRLALAVIKVESNFKQDAVSTKGARGLFQIKPSLAKYIAKDAGVKYDGNHSLHEADKNVKLGVYHLSKLVEDFENLPTALHAYNAGESRLKARKSNKEPKTAFTRKVLREYESNLSVLPDGDELSKK
jgi:soluble lytic murein transglycosylase